MRRESQSMKKLDNPVIDRPIRQLLARCATSLHLSSIVVLNFFSAPMSL